MSDLPLRWRLAVLGLVVLLAAGGVAVVATRAVHEAARAQQPTAATGVDLALAVTDVRSQPHVVFRSTALGPTYGRLGLVPLADPQGPRAVTELECERVDATASGGSCLTADRGVVTTYGVTLLDSDLRPGRSWTLGGPPSRTRLSDDGGLVGTTAFVTGHSYAGTAFSTETVVTETDSGRSLGSLEDFEVTVDGVVSSAPDLNVWGVTFRTEPGRLLATVATGGRTWLVEGDLERRTLRTIREDVECPSLSPDGTRVAFKQRAAGVDAGLWRLHVLDLRTGDAWPLAEERTVDDQVEWLDEDRVLYGLPGEGGETDVWVVPVAGGAPEVFLPRAWSPAVVREVAG